MPDRIDLSQMESVVITIGQYQRIRRHWISPKEHFWDEIWDTADAKSYWKLALTGKGLGEYEPLFRKYLAPGSKILEAGCGLGQVVLALRYLGHDAHGLDYASRTIALLQKHFPEVPFKQGDIRDLPYENQSFDAYVSLGVIEHFPEGQDRMLAEGYRVLRTGGKIFLSAPVLNSYRRLRARLGMYRREPSLEFFKDCYSQEELEYLLQNAGFTPLETVFSNNTVMTFVQESFIRPLYRPVEDMRYVRGVVDRFLRLFLPRSWFSHMIMIVAEKPAAWT